MPNVVRPAKKPEVGVARIKVDGEVFTIRFKEVTGADASAFRQATKMSVKQAMSLLSSDEDADIDLLAGIIFLARRQRGEKHVKFETVAESVSYDSDIELPDDDEDSADADPET